MIEKLESLLQIIEDSSFPEKTKQHLKALIGLELSGKGQKEFRDFVHDVNSSEPGGESS